MTEPRRRPEYLFENCPADLKRFSSWLVWKYGTEKNDKGKFPKLPYDLSKPARTVNKKDAAKYSFDEVRDAFIKDEFWDGIGFLSQGDVIGVDFDGCVQDDEITNAAVLAELEALDSYTEISPSGTGIRVWIRGKAPLDPEDPLKLKLRAVHAKAGRCEIYPDNRDSSNFLTFTGWRLEESNTEVRQVPPAAVTRLYDFADSNSAARPKSSSGIYSPMSPDKRNRAWNNDLAEWEGDESAAVHALLPTLAIECGGDPALTEAAFMESDLYKQTKWGKRGKWKRRRSIELEAAVRNARLYLAKLAKKQKNESEQNDGSTWRQDCKSKSQLTNKPPAFVIGGLIPEKALTFIVAPSYHGKTWLALQLGKAVSSGAPFHCFPGPESPVPVIYHVPEMNEALVRQRMDQLEIEDSEMFLVRAMESGIWPLADARMVKSSAGRLVFLDTVGYFNPADEVNAYNQAVTFANLVFNLMNAGAIAVVALYHPPKSSTQTKNEPTWTLENSVLGSAAYGGILRSCLRLRNLNADLNDPNVWVYVQGMKNPGLKPFQLEGLPLRVKVAPGESPYLPQLLNGSEPVDPRYLKASELFASGMPQRKVAEQLKVSVGMVNKWHQQWAAGPSFENDSHELPF